MTGPVPLASGRDADVFAIDARRVLRRYREGGDVTTEAAIMRHLYELGFPVPRVYEADNADLMERLDGPTMLHALVAGDVGADDGGALLADLHDRLHDLPPRLSTDPQARVLHLDLHPDNVILTGRGPVVIDWRNASEGPADLDLALTGLILAQVAVDRDHDMSEPAAALLKAFLQRAGGDAQRMLGRAVEMRAGDPALTADEVGRLAAAEALIRRCTSSPNSPRTPSEGGQSPARGSTAPSAEDSPGRSTDGTPPAGGLAGRAR